MKLTLWLILGSVVFGNPNLWGQLSPVYTKYYSYKDGLPDRIIYDVLEDSRGVMWASTPSGISMYDGHKIRNFSNLQLPNIAQQINVRGAGTLAEDAHQNLIIQPENHPDSLEVFNVETLESYGVSLRHSTQMKGYFVDLFSVPLGSTFVLMRDDAHLFIYEWLGQQNFKLIKKIESLSEGLPKDDRLIATSDREFWVFDALQKRIICTSATQELQNIPIENFFGADPRSAIFHLTKQGGLLLTMANEKRIYFYQKPKEPSPKVEIFETEFKFNLAWEDEHHHLILSATLQNYSERLILINPEREVIPLDKLREQEAKITNIRGTDFRKNLFLTSFNGFYQFGFSSQKKRIRNYLKQDLRDGQFGNIMRGFVGDGKGKVYAAEEGEHWYVLNTDDFELEELTIKDEFGQFLKKVSCGGNLLLTGDYLWGMSCDENASGRIHRYHIPTKKWGLWKIPLEKTFGRLLLKKSETEFWLFTLHRTERNGNIFIFNTETKKFTSFEEWAGKKAPLEEHIINHVIQTKDGLLWIGTSNGLLKFDPQTKTFDTFYIDEQRKDGNRISALHENEKGELWVGTFEQGLFVFDPKTENFSRFSLYPANEQFRNMDESILPNNYIAGILPINSDEYFVSTFIGLAYLNLAEKTAAHYFSKDGFSNDEYNRLSFYQDERENIFMGGINGFDVFKIEDLKEKKTQAKPRLTNFFSYDKSSEKVRHRYADLDFSEKLIIEPNNLFFGFEFMLPSYFNSENNSFQTWLEGWENGFNASTTNPRVQFYRLPPGEYKLHIKAKDGQGNESMGELVIPIKVERIFYETWQFLTFVALLLFGGIAFYVKRKIDKIRKKRRLEKEQRDNQRKFLELELKTLRMQLNPHFMFNALSAIQFFIQENDSRLAINYLADFARLMRLFLESSKKKYIYLNEELELIQLYVSLERMRFGNKFEVEYQIDESLDLTNTEIPSLLLQPFIENSINHGLRHKAGQGKLTIKIRNDEAREMIHCIIEDDGIGRKRAAEIKKKSLKKHISRGTQIVQERLDAFRESGELQLEVKTEDVNVLLEDCGTRVTISVPEVF